MPSLELPHTPNCLVCGRSNPHGLHLSLHVEERTGIVTTTFTPTADHIGFEGIIHGGILATILDEAMVWAATWSGKRFCVCGELSIRYKQSAVVGQTIIVTAAIDQARKKLITTTGQVHRASADGARRSWPRSSSGRAAFRAGTAALCFGRARARSEAAEG